MSELAEKIDRLFKSFTKPDGSEYTYREVEEGTGNAITAAYVWRLRTGKADNPGYRVLAALCHFFGVSITYFFSDEPEAEAYVEDLKLAKALRKTGVEQIALRAGDLDEDSQQDVLRIIEYVRKAQGLENPKEGDQVDGQPAKEDEKN